MIKLFIVFVLGLFFGAVATCIAVVAGDAERCAECRRKARNDMGVNEVDRWCNACKNYGNGLCNDCTNLEYFEWIKEYYLRRLEE